MEYSGVQFQLGFLGYNFCLGGEKLKTLPLMSNFEKIIRLKRISLFRLNQPSEGEYGSMGKLIEFKLQRFFFPFVRLANTRDIKFDI